MLCFDVYASSGSVIRTAIGFDIYLDTLNIMLTPMVCQPRLVFLLLQLLK